jgi:hypothetical protein
MLEAKSLVQLGGAYHLGCAILHVFFPKLLNWKEDLASVSPHNRAVVWILSKLLMYAYAAVGLGSIYFASEISSSRPGRYFLVLVSGFWLFRAAFQVKFFKEFGEYLGSTTYNLLMLLLWLLGAGLYAAPLFRDLV